MYLIIVLCSYYFVILFHFFYILFALKMSIGKWKLTVFALNDIPVLLYSGFIGLDSLYAGSFASPMVFVTHKTHAITFMLLPSL